MKYNTTTLDNGLRIIHLASASPVVYCGYQINVGARHEAPGEEGLAHFCEHVTFKGTAHRKAWNIINRLESVGGDLNAYTNKEDTTYYAAILKEHVERATELLTDIVFHSVYPQQEIDKEIEVICDEIESYNDSPSELIYDEFENLIFQQHPLGHNILGTAANVRSFNTAKALEFTGKYYRPDNAIFFIYGDVDFDQIVRLLKKQHRHILPLSAGQVLPIGIGCPTGHIARCQASVPTMPKASEGMPVNKVGGQTFVYDKHTHQAHVMMGCTAYNIHDKRRMSLYLLNNILGGPGMNARLNIVLREHNGLVYTVDSSMVSYGDTGLWCTYFGCDQHDIKKCLRLVRNELKRFMDKPVSETKLRAAKKQIKGQIGVACDNRESFALDFGKSFLHYGWEKDITNLYKNIDEVTAEGIQAVANEIFSPDRLTTLIYQ